jgi:NAD(P)-dependent dehydrogenase (short-subunit alcohol dehydrogenase family)
VSDLPMRGRVALVAGASKGIGAVTAQAFADAGAAVVVAARNAAAVQAMADRIEASAAGRSPSARTSPIVSRCAAWWSGR